MRLLFIVLFFASSGMASPWLDGPTTKATKSTDCGCEFGKACSCDVCRCDKPPVGRTIRVQVEETTDAQPRQTNQTATSPKAKASKESSVGNCATCGNLCCCRDCKCTATTWDFECCAMPMEEKNAYVKKLQARLAARSVPQANFQQGAEQASPFTTQAIPANAGARYSAYPAMGQYQAPTFTAAPAGYPSTTSGGSG